MAESLGSAVLELEADRSKLDRDLSGAERGVSQTLSGMGDRSVKTGKTLTKSMTAPIVGLGAAAVMTGVKFDDRMARVQAISGATGDEFDSMRDKAQQLGSTTRFSASEAAEGMEFMALAGFDANETIAAMPGVLDLASAGQLELGQASDIVTDTMSAFGMSADQAGEAADIFARQSSIANTSVDQLGSAMTRAAPAANAVGMGMADTSAVLGVFADQGLKGQRAGTTLDAMLRDLNESAEDGAVAIGDASVAVFDAEGKMRSFGDIMRDVTDATQGMSDEQREQALRSVFQQQSLRGVNMMLGDGIDSFDKYRQANLDSAGAAGEMAETMEDTLGGAFREMRSQLEGVLIQMSDVLTPLIREQIVPAVQQFGEWISRLLDWFGELDPRIQTAIVAFAGLLAALGPLLILAGMFVNAVAAIIPVLLWLAGAINLPIVAIAALVAAFVLAYSTSETFRDVVNGAFSAVKSVITTVMKAVQKLITTVISGIKAAWDRWGGDLVAIAQRVWDTVTSVVTTAINAVQAVIAGVTATIQQIWRVWGDTILSFLTATWENIKLVVGGALDVVLGIIKTVLAAIQGDWSGAWQGIKQVLSGVWQIIQGVVGQAINMVASTISAALAGIKAGWQAAWDAAKSTLSSAWEAIKSGVQSGIDTVLGLVRDLPGKIMSALGNIGSLLLDAGKNVIGGLVDGIKSKVPDVIGAITDVAGKVRDALPFSPAKYGPLAGSGSPDRAGERIGEMLADGLDRVDLAAAMSATLPDIGSLERSRALSGVGEGATSEGGGQRRGDVNITLQSTGEIRDDAQLAKLALMRG